MRSDRRARALIILLCLAPVATPLLAAGLNSFLKSPSVASPASAATPVSAPTLKPAPVPVVRASPQGPTLRASFDDPIFSPMMMGVAAPIEAKWEAASPQAEARTALTGRHVLRDVRVAGSLQIVSEGIVISLAGVAPTPDGSECRRLDGVVESCAQRAANRLALLTQGRPIVCDLQGDAARARGICRAGTIDLAEDLVRNGLAVRTSDQL